MRVTTLPGIAAVLFLAFGACAQHATPAGPARVPNRPADSHPAPASPQPRNPPPPGLQPGAAPNSADPRAHDTVRAQVMLGLRVDAVRLAAAQVATVVIVNDAPSYLDAIAGWTPAARYPVLIDDGTFESRENIARFVRAFAPARVVRWSSLLKPRPRPVQFNAVDPADVVACVARAWGVPEGPRDAAALLARYKELNHVPPGLVVAAGDDGAWTAAVALAAGRGQIVAFIPTPRVVGSAMSIQQADALETAIESEAERTGLPWKGLGDGLDAVTICQNTPARIERGNESLALTDRIGRRGEGDSTERWAWCGQVFGSPQESAYRAMCALFIQPTRAWLFNGYPKEPGFDAYAVRPAEDLFRRVGLPVDSIDGANQSADAWRALAARANPADLLMVTTKGMAEWFDLNPGQCRAGDVPILERPAAVYVVHSFSAARADDRRTIAGRFLANGAFAYVGSVHEPFLGAFIPPRVLAGRLLSQCPLGGAVRLDAGPVWKIAVFGDPLYTLGLPVRRTDDPPPLDGAAAVGADLRDLLTGPSPHEGLRTLVLLGRDEDAARFACAVLESQPDRVSPAFALDAVMPVFRSGRTREVAAFVARLDRAGAALPAVRDALWLSAFPRLNAPDETLLKAMRATLRPEWEGATRDAADLARAWARAYGVESAAGMLAALRSETEEGMRRYIDQARDQTVGK